MILVTLQRNGDRWRAYWRQRGAKKYRSLGPATGPRKISKGHATRLCRELEERLNAGAPGTPAAFTIESWRLRFLDQKSSEIAEETVALYRASFGYLEAHMGPGTRIEEVTRSDAANFRAFLAEQPIAVATARSHMRRIRSAFEEAKRQDFIVYNPFDREKTSEPRVEKDWAGVTRDDLARVMEACPSDSWRILFALCRLAGLRRGEAMRLAWRDIDWERRTLTVRPEGGKVTTKQRLRVVPMEPDLYDTMLEAFGSRDALPSRVIDGVLVNGNIDREAKSIIARAGLEPWAKPFHTLRKCLVSEWQAKYPAYAVNEWLGHSADVSQRHYYRTDAATIAQVTKVQGQGIPQGIDPSTTPSTAVPEHSATRGATP